MPVLPSMRSSCVAIVAVLAAASAPACKPAYHLPRGFEVDQPIEVSANGAATLHLPANARGAVYTDVDARGRPHRPAVAAFRLVDRTTSRRQAVQVVETSAMVGGRGVYLVEPVGGFVAGHAYTLSTSRRYEMNSPFYPSLRLLIDAAIAWPPRARPIQLQPRPQVVEGTAFTFMTPIFDPGLIPYRGQIRSTMQASPPVKPEEAYWSDCTWGDVSMLRRTAACHAITAIFSYPAMSDEPAVVKGANRAECAGR